MRVVADPPPAWLASVPIRRGVVATGHQAWLWHPGILAKDIAAASLARSTGAQVWHVVVDHDPVEALRLELPVRDDGRASVLSVELGGYRADVPPCLQPAVDPAGVVDLLRRTAGELGSRLLADPSVLIEAWTEAPASGNLAEQVAGVTARLMRPWTGDVRLVYASRLLAEPQAAALVQRMIGDARHCVACYNRAVAAHPHAGVKPLAETNDAVELPLWARLPGGRARVYADLTDSRNAAIFSDDDRADLGPTGLMIGLMPKALLLTAVMRSLFCDLFIHGTGGGAYDRITEQWWHEWTGERLAPMAVVSADVTLALPAEVPVAEPGDVHRAVWRAHHLRHNPDREPETVADAALAARKRDLVGRMDDDRDRRRRAAVFAEIHRINKELAARHPGLLARARADIERARIGAANLAVARKRDWCFALYPPQTLRELAAALNVE